MLDDTTKKKLGCLMEVLEEIAKNIDEPMDPKIESTIELAHAIARDQLEANIAYTGWSEPAKLDDKYIGNEKIPTKEDLERWMSGE